MKALLLLLSVSLAGGALPLPAMAEALPQDSLAIRIIDFITHPPIDAVPYDRIESFDASARPRLRTLLADPQYEQYAPQIVILLGHVGDAGDTPLLRHYILQRFTGEIDDDQLTGIFNALAALGWLSDRDPAALALLRQAADPNFFKHTRYKSAPRGDEGLRLVLSKIAINGIGFSARPETEAMLLVLEQNPYHEAQLGNIEDSLRRHRAIVKVGRKNSVAEMRRARAAERGEESK